ncbi:RNA polymerase sigma factor [Paenibacillus tarimensis]|uniref:RNA polymerase sigma factor n=1 Tax=Paenibacillus tarimensis TaxID=416012 RepID=UPI001F3D7C8C|nr:sigma-70 family RNA polymerase sigma factor [Paenibacillus tarimensis]MCF2943082.1 sigma-70 family RNA polymerase sigma factor [Paenibacillus tarimensis]
MEHSYYSYLTELDPESFRNLMNEYGQDVWNLAFVLTRRHELADDITQDVFLNVYQNITSFRGQSSMKTWLLSITRNRSINVLRTAFMRKVTLMDIVAPKTSVPSAEHSALEHTLSEEIWAAVLKLPLKLREVLILHAKYELSTKEISELLKLPEGTVKSRLSRARVKMNTGWKEANHVEGT